jgi:hypothetical protein
MNPSLPVVMPHLTDFLVLCGNPIGTSCSAEESTRIHVISTASRLASCLTDIKVIYVNLFWPMCRFQDRSVAASHHLIPGGKLALTNRTRLKPPFFVLIITNKKSSPSGQMKW